jgi:hypothetical protein
MTREVERSVLVTVYGHLWLLVGKPLTKLGLDGDAEFLALKRLAHVKPLRATRNGYEVDSSSGAAKEVSLSDGSEVMP